MASIFPQGEPRSQFGERAGEKRGRGAARESAATARVGGFCARESAAARAGSARLHLPP